MANMLKTGAQWLSDMRTAHMAEQLTYKRSNTTVTVMGTPGKTDYEVADESGLKVGSQVTDFLIIAADLILGGVVTTPQHGDQIIFGSSVYEVLNLPGDGCWRYSDPYKIALRIHTKQIS
jgi:hypothetical protein